MTTQSRRRLLQALAAGTAAYQFLVCFAEALNCQPRRRSVLPTNTR
jgi:hypothetical protein